jgi:hypothetical protein
MRLIRLALALVAVSVGGIAMANPAINNSVSGAVGGTVGATVGTTAATQMVVGQSQARLDGGRLGDARSNFQSSRSESSLGGGMDDSMPRGWLMLLVTVLLIGHQLRRKHRFLRPQRFSDL